MDSLIESIRVFAICKNENLFERSIEHIIGKMENMCKDETDPDLEWDILKENYYKLREIHDLLNFYDIPENKKFRNLLDTFIHNIDNRTNVYLEFINWHGQDDEIKEECIEIEQLLYKSIENTELSIKFEAIFQAYERLMIIVQDFRNDYSVPDVSNDPLIKELKRKRK
jgi:hypothetical protein